MKTLTDFRTYAPGNDFRNGSTYFKLLIFGFSARAAYRFRRTVSSMLFTLIEFIGSIEEIQLKSNKII